MGSDHLTGILVNLTQVFLCVGKGQGKKSTQCMRNSFSFDVHSFFLFSALLSWRQKSYSTRVTHSSSS